MAEIGVRVEEAICRGSGPGPNEDAIGMAFDGESGAAWVLDGATGLADRNFVPGADTDARWYATRLAAILADLSLEPAPPNVLLHRAIARIDAEYRRLVGPDLDTVPAYGFPSAAGVWLRWNEERRLDYAGLGDCRVLVRGADGAVRRLGQTGDDPGDRLVNRAVTALQAGGIADPAAVWVHLLDRVRAARSGMNRPDGYWVFGIVPAAADHCDTDQMILDPGSQVLMVSDGFYRLVDTYHAFTAESLVTGAAELGLDALYSRLRAIEADDAACRCYPRLKPGDDASAVLLRVG